MSASANVSGTENGDTTHVLTTQLLRKTASCPPAVPRNTDQ